jgi:hypothetical protein
LNSGFGIKLACRVGVPLRTLSEGELFNINNAPQAQKRTAKFKKSVYVVEDLVFKGPYQRDDPGLINSIRYTHALELLEILLHMPEWQRGSLRWLFLGFTHNDQCYLVAPNVGSRNNIKFETVTTKIEKNVKVVPRQEHVMRVSDIEGNDQLTNEIKMATLQHLYFRFLLGIGDSGTHNVLVRKDSDLCGRLIAGVDLDERRGNNSMKSRLDFLFKRAPSKKQAALYHSFIDDITALSFNQFDKQTSEKLWVVEIDLDRLKEKIELWEALP